MKMNKKVLSMFVVGVLALGLGSAMLVNYLSNNVKGTVNVESPMLITLNCSSENCLEDMFAGETLEIPETVTKLSNGITGDMNVAITIYNFDGEGIDMVWRHSSGVEVALVSTTTTSSDNVKTTVYSYPNDKIFNWDDVAQDYAESGIFLITANPALDTRDYDMSAKIVPITN